MPQQTGNPVIDGLMRAFGMKQMMQREQNDRQQLDLAKRREDRAQRIEQSQMERQEFDLSTQLAARGVREESTEDSVNRITGKRSGTRPGANGLPEMFEEKDDNVYKSYKGKSYVIPGRTEQDKRAEDLHAKARTEKVKDTEATGRAQIRVHNEDLVQLPDGRKVTKGSVPLYTAIANANARAAEAQKTRDAADKRSENSNKSREKAAGVRAGTAAANHADSEDRADRREARAGEAIQRNNRLHLRTQEVQLEQRESKLAKERSQIGGWLKAGKDLKGEKIDSGRAAQLHERYASIDEEYQGVLAQKAEIVRQRAANGGSSSAPKPPANPYR